MFIVKFPVIFAVVYVATSLVNKGEHIICYAYTVLQYKVCHLLMTVLVVDFVLFLFRVQG